MQHFFPFQFGASPVGMSAAQLWSLWTGLLLLVELTLLCCLGSAAFIAEFHFCNCIFLFQKTTLLRESSFYQLGQSPKILRIKPHGLERTDSQTIGEFPRRRKGMYFRSPHCPTVLSTPTLHMVIVTLKAAMQVYNLAVNVFIFLYICNKSRLSSWTPNSWVLCNWLHMFY